MESLKEGYKTSEFKSTLIAQVVGMILVSLGAIDTAELDDITQHIMLIVGSLSTVMTSSLYIYTRFKLKYKVLDNLTEESNVVG